jgi:hypothetical protein
VRAKGGRLPRRDGEDEHQFGREDRPDTQFAISPTVAHAPDETSCSMINTGISANVAARMIGSKGGSRDRRDPAATLSHHSRPL